jgi:uncharacterized membrane protein
MRMSPGVRRLALTVHVTASVGWLGGGLVAGVVVNGRIFHVVSLRP